MVGAVMSRLDDKPVVTDADRGKNDRIGNRAFTEKSPADKQFRRLVIGCIVLGLVIVAAVMAVAFGVRS
jgi:hypothetical protein